MNIDPDELAVMRFMLDHLERVSGAYDPQLRDHIVQASNCLYDLTNADADLPSADDVRGLLTLKAKWYDAVAYFIVMHVPVSPRFAWLWQKHLLPYAARWAYRNDHDQGDG